MSDMEENCVREFVQVGDKLYLVAIQEDFGYLRHLQHKRWNMIHFLVGTEFPKLTCFSASFPATCFQ